MTDIEIQNCSDLSRLRMKADQAWDMAGLARQDRDKPDEKRRTDEARKIEKRISELKNL